MFRTGRWVSGVMYTECIWFGRRVGGFRRLTGVVVFGVFGVRSGRWKERWKGRSGGSLMLVVGMIGVRRGVFFLIVAKDDGFRRGGAVIAGRGFRAGVLG